MNSELHPILRGVIPAPTAANQRHCIAGSEQNPQRPLATSLTVPGNVDAAVSKSRPPMTAAEHNAFPKGRW